MAMDFETESRGGISKAFIGPITSWSGHGVNKAMGSGTTRGEFILLYLISHNSCGVWRVDQIRDVLLQMHVLIILV